MTRATPELAPPLQTSAPHPLEEVWLSTYGSIGPRNGGIFSGFEFRNGALRPQSRGLITRPPQSHLFLDILQNKLCDLESLPDLFSDTGNEIDFVHSTSNESSNDSLIQSLSVVWKFGAEVSAQESSSSSDRGSKFRRPSQNSPRVASKRDVKITDID
ncbi:hypothetical protein AVEN_101716-1 [Araneus ventricosus]|uniref:Uncharacterized protein n=1 Tax=Araneus ventricosus TaxID=182803 RepID=A0A4Y2LI40_ARAVE|nr:hypothetical protein AVEN_101716-1 [Araneus ventricosus]